MGKATVLYEIRHGDEVVYVGITTNPGKRFSVHRSKYGPDCEIVAVEWFACREFATRVESARIKTLRPKFNLSSKDRSGGKRAVHERDFQAWQLKVAANARSLEQANAEYDEWIRSKK